MKTKFVSSSERPLIFLMLSLMFAFCFGSCKDNDPNVETDPPYDPSKPVVVSGFSPETGGVGQRLLIYGSNFGNDTSLVRVFIGGKEATVVSVGKEALYCIVPSRAFKGDIEVRVGTGSSPIVVQAVDSFKYERKMVVSTVCGYKTDRDDQGWRDGPFDGPDDVRTTGFRYPSFMKFDPHNKKHLYVTYDDGPIQIINFEDSTTYRREKSMGAWSRLRSVEFTLDGNYMIVSNDQGGSNDVSTSIMERTSDRLGFGNPQVLTRSKQCNGASIHPVNGEMYFNSYEKGEFRRYEIDSSQYFGGRLSVSEHDMLFLVQDNGWEFNIQIHPTGNYAYIVVINQHYILRTNYNWALKRFTTPFVVCGRSKSSGYLEGVGDNVRLAKPYQGIFVKNPKYTAAGEDDEYDFYFTQRDNHCISILTPNGSVSTYAGRGSSSLNGNPYGMVEGDLRQEARFDQPTGLAYNEEENAFYVNDLQNRRLRKISMEIEEEE